MASSAAAGPAPSTWAGSCGPLVIGHRGEPAVAPEESIDGYRAALRHGAHLLEGDIHFTRDGKPVLIHDDTVDRTTDGTGRVDAMSLRQIRRLDAGAGTKVPRVGELLDLTRPRREVRLILELKQPGASREQVQTFWSAVRARGMTGRVTVESFYPENLALMRTVAPQARTAPITRYAVSGEQARSQGPVLIPELSISTADQVREWHKAGLKVYAWTADTRADWGAARDARVDGVLTNRTGAYEAWVAAGCH